MCSVFRFDMRKKADNEKIMELKKFLEYEENLVLSQIVCMKSRFCLKASFKGVILSLIFDVMNGIEKKNDEYTEYQSKCILSYIKFHVKYLNPKTTSNEHSNKFYI